MASHLSRTVRQQQRARYARTNGDMLLGGPLNPSESDPVTFWWTGDDQLHLSPQGGGNLAAVTRATSLIADTLGSLPWRLLTGGQDQSTSIIELPTPRWLSDPMLTRPDSRFGPSPTPAALRLTASSFWGQWIRSALMKGRGILIFEEGAEGQPVAGTLRLLNPDHVSPMGEPYIHRRIGTNEGGYIDTDYDGRFQVGTRVYRMVELLNPLDIVDEFGCARGVLEMHADEVGMARQQVAYGTGTYRSGVPAGYLKVSVPNYSKAQADDLRARWLEAHGGDKRSVAVLNASTDFTPIQMSPVDMALIEAKKMSLVDIANATGVPVYHLNGGDSGGLTYSTAESRSRDLVTYTLMPWASAVESLLTALLPAGQFAEVQFSGLLRADTKTRYEAYSVGLRDGWLTVDEVRTLESLPPLEGAERTSPVKED